MKVFRTFEICWLHWHILPTGRAQIISSALHYRKWRSATIQRITIPKYMDRMTQHVIMELVSTYSRGTYCLLTSLIMMSDFAYWKYPVSERYSLYEPHMKWIFNWISADTPFGQLKLNEVGAWLGRRNKNPRAFVGAISRGTVINVLLKMNVVCFRRNACNIIVITD